MIDVEQARIQENRAKYLEFIRNPENEQRHRINFSIWDRTAVEPKFCVLGAAMIACDLVKDYNPGLTNAYEMSSEALGLRGNMSWYINRKNDAGDGPDDIRYNTWAEIADWIETVGWGDDGTL